MIGYVTVGVSDMEKAKAFYCDLFADRGAKVIIDGGRIAMIGTEGRITFNSFNYFFFSHFSVISATSVRQQALEKVWVASAM